MAVQAQYPSNAFGPSAANNVLEGFQKLQYCENPSGNLFAVCNNYVGQQVMNGAVISEPGSVLTCDASGSKKRSRDAQMAVPEQRQLLQRQQHVAGEFRNAAFSTRLLNSCNKRFDDSAVASTSGRSVGVSLSLDSPVAQDLSSCLYHHNRDTDAVVRFQNERLRLLLDETRKRHYRSLLAVLEREVLNRLREKQTELDDANRRNAELAEKVKQMTAENEIWFNVARNNEAIVSSLRSSIEQVLQNSSLTKEGFGESDGVGGILSDDAASCCNENVAEGNTFIADKTVRENRELKHRKLCKLCGGNDISVLLLPCRHLCLCKECEPKLESCPICNSAKNASLQVFMS